ncbi:MAG: alpha/beta hydrolase [Hyphomicrobiales bacterium]|nr:MAG: alpha/beta hydrolase [Hyphomicrobiales bacterium]
MVWVVLVPAGLLLAYLIGGVVLLQRLLTPGGVDWSGANNPNPPKDPLVLNYRGDPRTAFGFDFTTIQYMTEHGPAEAWLVPAREPSPLWAIYVHGIGGLRENGYKQLSVLHEAGIPTLLITYRNDRGAPASPNRLYSFGLTEWRDLDAAIGWMQSRGAQRIVLVAESMGAAIAGQYLTHAADISAIAALALDAPALDFPSIPAGILGRYHAPFATATAALGIGALKLFTGTDLATANCMDAVARFERPLFLAHGTGDLLVPLAQSEELVARRTAPTVFIQTGATHLHSFNEDPARYRAAFLGFLDGLSRNSGGSGTSRGTSS